MDLVTAKQIWDTLKNAKRVAILGHINADGDCISSCVAAKQLISHADIVYEEELPKRFVEIFDDNYIVYDGTLEHYDVVVALDCGDMGRLGKRIELFQNASVRINIDHHVSNIGYGDLNLVIPKASATAEVLYLLLRSLEIDIDYSIARALFVGISSDTGHFKFGNTTSKTFQIGAELVEAGVNVREITKLLYETNDYNYLMFTAEATETIEMFDGGNLSILSVTKEMIDKHGISYSDIDSISQLPRTIRGVKVGVVLKEQDGEIKVSLRSDGYINLSEFAMRFGGGGHKNAAGISFSGKTLEEVKAIMVKELVF